MIPLKYTLIKCTAKKLEKNYVVPSIRSKDGLSQVRHKSCNTYTSWFRDTLQCDDGIWEFFGKLNWNLPNVAQCSFLPARDQRHSWQRASQHSNSDPANTLHIPRQMLLPWGVLYRIIYAFSTGFKKTAQLTRNLLPASGLTSAAFSYECVLDPLS